MKLRRTILCNRAQARPTPRGFTLGFTLLELLLVVLLLGILSAIGVPIYQDYITSANQSQAENNLRAVFLKQQEYYANNQSYYNSGAVCGDHAASINTNLFEGQHYLTDHGYSYCITQTAGTDFTARAQNADGSVVLTINQNQVTNF